MITDTDDPKQKQINKNNQIDFRETLAPDMLIVNFMLTTGYDVKRLKKMYLLTKRISTENIITKFQRFEKIVRDIQDEIKKNKNKGDIKIRKLDELLQKIFHELSISDLSDLDSITDEHMKR